MIRCRMKWHLRWIGFVVALPDELVVLDTSIGSIRRSYKAGHPFVICACQQEGGWVTMVPDGDPGRLVTMSIGELNRGGLLVLAPPYRPPQDYQRVSWEIDK